MKTSRYLALALSIGSVEAHAIPPPPPAPRQLREVRMTVTVRLIEAHRGEVSRMTRLCTVSGKVPVYADDGSASSAHQRPIPGCSMRWKGQDLGVSVRGALAIARGPATFAVASVAAVPADARPLCPDLCAPQPLADSGGQIRIGGLARAFKFGLGPNPVSILNANPTVWLEADVEVGR